MPTPQHRLFASLRQPLPPVLSNRLQQTVTASRLPLPLLKHDQRPVHERGQQVKQFPLLDAPTSTHPLRSTATALRRYPIALAVSPPTRGLVASVCSALRYAC